MNIVEKSVTDLRGYKKNNKSHPAKQVQMIADSITQFGFRNPIIIDKNNEIIAGHGRLLGAKQLGMETVPCIIADDLTEDQVRAYRLLDNRIGDFGEYNIESIMGELKDIGNLQLGLESLDNLFTDLLPEKENEKAEEDDYEVPEEIKTDIVIGDLFEIGEHRLLCGDSTDKEQVVKLMNGKKADMVFTDPPYGVDVVGNSGNIGGNTKNAKAGNYSKIIGDDKPYDPSHLFTFDCFIFIWGANYFIDKLPSRGQWVVWDKNRPEGTTFSDCELAWTNGDGIAIKKYKCTWDGFHREGEKDKRVHPTQKPIKLCNDILNNLSKQNEIIIDLFLGSGSTMVASHQLKRKCYGMELDPKYCQVIIDRMIKLDPTLEIKKNGLPYNQANNG